MEVQTYETIGSFEIAGCLYAVIPGCELKVIL